MTAPGGERRVAQPAVRSIDAEDGVALLYRIWEVDRPRGCLWIVHGLGEHGGRYAALAEALLERGIATVAADLRGHGMSGGRRGHVDRFDEYLGDLERVVEHTRCGAPGFLLGHSLGGLIALRAVETGRAGKLSGAILSAPALELALPVSRWQDPVAAVLSRIVPTLARPNGIPPGHLSHDPQSVAAYEADPLVHDRITTRLYTEMRRAMEAAAEEAKGVKLPVLLLAPGDDRVTLVAKAIEVVATFGTKAEVRRYPGFFHEPLHERQRAEVLDDILEWIEDSLGDTADLAR